jgi:hypothetical protein
MSSNLAYCRILGTGKPGGPRNPWEPPWGLGGLVYPLGTGNPMGPGDPWGLWGQGNPGGPVSPGDPWGPWDPGGHGTPALGAQGSIGGPGIHRGSWTLGGPEIHGGPRTPGGPVALAALGPHGGQESTGFGLPGPLVNTCDLVFLGPPGALRGPRPRKSVTPVTPSPGHCINGTCMKNLSARVRSDQISTICTVYTLACKP